MTERVGVIVVHDGYNLDVHAQELVDVYVVDRSLIVAGGLPVRLPDTEVFHELVANSDLVEGKDVRFHDEPVLASRDALGECIAMLTSGGSAFERNLLLERARRAYEEAA